MRAVYAALLDIVQQTRSSRCSAGRCAPLTCLPPPPNIYIYIYIYIFIKKIIIIIIINTRYTPTLPTCQPLNDSNRLCSSFNTTAQLESERFADEYGQQKGLVRLMIVPSTHYNTTLPAAELLDYPDSALCPSPTTPYKACSASSMKWVRANASNIRGFSATAWYTGSNVLQYELQQQAGYLPPLPRPLWSSITRAHCWDAPTLLLVVAPHQCPRSLVACNLIYMLTYVHSTFHIPMTHSDGRPRLGACTSRMVFLLDC